MRKLTLFFTPLMITLLLILFGCESEPQRREAPSGNTTTAPVPTPPRAGTTGTPEMQERARDFTAAMESRINEADQKLGSLKSKVDNFSDEKKAEMQQLIRSLEVRKNIAHERLETLKIASAQTWQNLKASTEEAVDNLQEFLNALEARLQQ